MLFHFQRLKRRAEEANGKTAKEGTSYCSPAKRLKPLNRCAKCGFTSEDQAQFQEHIPQHRTDSDTPQCQYCGLCFTSQQALSRHLFIVHKVKEQEEQQDSKNEVANRKGVNSTDLRDERKPVPLLPKITGLSTEEDHSESVAHESIDRTCSNTQTLETSGFVQEEKT